MEFGNAEFGIWKTEFFSTFIAAVPCAMHSGIVPSTVYLHA
ncbi:hypothetical protein D1BOALGB6SA_415 [Olavius sp. associated proteobacterium Delta 1]|nr:hypothetical protein D1BOALGB6SA_415 [Olavius sp. associated proteobacterium Delta 1]